MRAPRLMMNFIDLYEKSMCIQNEISNLRGV
jgi:hypothetical protein